MFHLPTPRKGIETCSSFITRSNGLQFHLPTPRKGIETNFTAIAFTPQVDSPFHLPTPRKGIETLSNPKSPYKSSECFTYLLPARGLKLPSHYSALSTSQGCFTYLLPARGLKLDIAEATSNFSGHVSLTYSPQGD